MSLLITCVRQSELCVTIHADVSVHRGRRLSVNNKVDILTNKEAENRKILHFFVGGSRVDPKAGAAIWDYMMEQVKPQHSFSSVRPVLVRGEEVCWALDRGRLVGTPQIQQRKKTSKPRYMIEFKDSFLDTSIANSASPTTSKISSRHIPVFIFLGNLEFRKSAISLSSSFSLQKKKKTQNK